MSHRRWPAHTYAHRWIARILALVLAAGLCACTQTTEEPLPSMTGTVVSIEKYGHTVLDISLEEFREAGFELGDMICVTMGDFQADMPCYNSYYAPRGEYMARFADDEPVMALCINYGSFAEAAGAEVGDTVSFTMKEKAARLATQEVLSMTYTNRREDYAGDEIFANFRAVSGGEIAADWLYRASSPINNKIGRAATVDRLVEAANVQCVICFGEPDEGLAEHMQKEDFNSPYYRSLWENGQVCAISILHDFTAPEYIDGIVEAMICLSENEGPYLIHCQEGKDRTGFAAMLLAALMGATLDEINEDYMRSFENLFGVDRTTDPARYAMIQELNLLEMLEFLTGVEGGAAVKEADLVAAAENYLLTNGMTAEAIEKLKENLRGESAASKAKP